MSAYDMSFSHIQNKERLLCLKKTSAEGSILLIANFSDDKEDVSDFLDGTKILFKNSFNAQTRMLDAGGILIAELR